jgi:quinolinate synthase
MLRFAAESEAPAFVIVTEEGILRGLEKAAPGKRFVTLAPRMLCPNMKLTTLEKVRDALALGQHEVDVDPEIRERARGAVDRMVAVD